MGTKVYGCLSTVWKVLLHRCYRAQGIINRKVPFPYGEAQREEESKPLAFDHSFRRPLGLVHPKPHLIGREGLHVRPRGHLAEQHHLRGGQCGLKLHLEGVQQ